MKRKVLVDIEELAMAMDMDFPEQHNFLDLETGEIVTYTDEFARELEDVYDEIYDEEGSRVISLEEYLEGRDDPDWQKEVLLTIDRVELGYGERYIRVEPDDRHADYHDMERFIDTVEDPDLRDRLWNAIRGRGAFRYFRDVVAERPEVEERWFEFKDQRLQQRVRDWLALRNIEPIGSED
jgi:hypothetical protein